MHKPEHPTAKKPDVQTARRALEEAALRKKNAAPRNAAKELGGPKGPEPTRFGDWERKGMTSDF